MQDRIFELLQKNHNGNICAVKYRGAWLLVDNRYLNWGTIIPPIKIQFIKMQADGQNGWNLCGKMLNVHSSSLRAASAF